MLLDLKLHVPHGGIFVLFIPGITNSLPLYLLTVVIGTAVTAGHALPAQTAHSR